MQMRTYIEINKNENGMHNDQTNSFFERTGVPEGWIEVPESLFPEWERYKPFLNITVQDCVVTSIVDDTEARTAWEAMPKPAPQQTLEDDLMSMMIDQEYRLTLLELGLA